MFSVIFENYKMIPSFIVHAVSTQGKTVGIMMYVTKYKLSSSLDGVYWNLYKEEQIDKVN